MKMNRGEVINGGFGLLLDGSEVNDYINFLSTISVVSLRLPLIILLVSLCIFQDAKKRAERMLSWDVSNGVRYNEIKMSCLVDRVLSI